MLHQVDNAIIMAAGTSSRFAPLSYEMPKGLISVRGEVLVEREIRQLQEAGIHDIILVTGYKKECYAYLAEKFGVRLVDNPLYATRNNNASIYAVKDFLKNSYICSSDNYFSENPFEREVDGSYYAAVYADGETAEWCMEEDPEGFISQVTVGGQNSWYMLGHVFWDEDFSRKFVEILEREYDLPETADKLWEQIFMEHLHEFRMKVRHYPNSAIFEFDTLDELRQFDESYWEDTRSPILEKIAAQLQCSQREIRNIRTIKAVDNQASGCTFEIASTGHRYEYDYNTMKLRRM